MIHLTLPFPPSVNHYWRHAVVNGRLANFLSKEAKAYRESVVAILFGEIGEPLTGPLRAELVYYAPSRHGRDVKNYDKGLLDALEHAGVYENDRQVWDCRIRWALGDHGKIVVAPPGKVEVTIEALKTAPVLFDTHEKGA